MLENSNAYKFSGFGTYEIVVYYDLFRYLLDSCFANEITQTEMLKQTAADWLKTGNGKFAPRTPENIIEAERRRLNLTMSAHECLIDEDCPLCVGMSEEFDTPTFWHLDGSQMEYDRFEFSFYKTRAEYEAEQRRYEEFNRDFAAGKYDAPDFMNNGEEPF